MRATHDRVAALVRPLDAARLAQRPEAGSWSVAEVLEHLCVSDEVYEASFDALLRSARVDAAAPAREWKPTFLGRLMVKTLTNPRRIPAPKMLRPGPVPRAAVVEKFLARDTRMLQRMEDAASLDWNALRLKPPTIPLPVRFNVGDLFMNHVVHVERHAGQIERIVQRIGG